MKFLQKKEEENQKKKVEKKSPRKQINVPVPDNKTIEQPDATRVAKKNIWMKRTTVDLKKAIPQKKSEKKEDIKEKWN